jgi:hypothetical protein
VRSSFPLLADFEDPDQIALWYGLNGGERRLDDAGRGHGGVLRLDIDGKQTYPGVTVVCRPHDWSHYQQLLVDVRLRPPAPDSLHVWLRLLDYEAKRDAEWAQRRYTATHAWKTLEFSLQDLRSRHHGRAFDLQDVHALTVGLSSTAGPAALEIDNVRLQRR